MNELKKYLNSLSHEGAPGRIQAISNLLGCSIRTAYRVIDGEKRLSPPEQKAIADLFDQPVSTLFPESQNQPV